MKLKAAILFLNVILFLPQLMQAETWTQKADFSGIARYSAVGFSINTKGYIGLGVDQTLAKYHDFWEWDQVNNVWTQIATFPGQATQGAGGFSLSNKGYVMGGGTSGAGEFWEWNQVTNIWVRRADFPGLGRVNPVTFSIGLKGYISTGSYLKDLWEWDGDTASATYNTWTRKADIPTVTGKGWATGFSIEKKGYVGTGTNGNNFENTFWEWDGDTASATYNTWTQKASLIGGARIDAVGFSIGNKGYVGTGLDSTTFIILKDFWEWDQSLNTWTKKLDFGGAAKQRAVGFSIGNRGYIGTGAPGNYGSIDFWEYCDTCTVGIDELNNKNIICIFPNPARDWIEILGNDIKSLMFYDVSGNIVYETNSEIISPFRINTYSFSRGVYFIKAKTKSRDVIRKVILQ